MLQQLGGMRLLGISGLVKGVTVSVVSGHVGAWLDRRGRRSSALIILFVNNVGTSLLFLIIAALLSKEALLGVLQIDRRLYNVLEVSALVVAVALFALTSCSTAALNYIYTGDWLVVMATWQSKRNQTDMPLSSE